jgi:hypothetical protein
MAFILEKDDFRAKGLQGEKEGRGSGFGDQRGKRITFPLTPALSLGGEGVSSSAIEFHGDP